MPREGFSRKRQNSAARLPLFVAAEKLVPGGVLIARAAGVALVVLGVLVAINPGLYGLLRGTTM